MIALSVTYFQYMFGLCIQVRKCNRICLNMWNHRNMLHRSCMDHRHSRLLFKNDKNFKAVNSYVW